MYSSMHTYPPEEDCEQDGKRGRVAPCATLAQLEVVVDFLNIVII